ncbi:hypothetical protein N657DRAFT_158483 [Parathielavia appendiculata]|uniref:Fungal lipase-type domain-containing protein n=1 Tax=Parathielavia appendiculata TaxID=2587402 RepID=A0AAN6YZT6_9PEZI|nr:hypothetical protein N657DRAFT_158483 [Parathielavia appendiculata]
MGGLRQSIQVLMALLMMGHRIHSIETWGHSLGGALATLCALWCSLEYPGLSITCLTLGSPIVGNQHFAGRFRPPPWPPITCFRLFIPADPAPALPNQYTQAVAFRQSYPGPQKWEHVGPPFAVKLADRIPTVPVATVASLALANRNVGGTSSMELWYGSSTHARVVNVNAEQEIELLRVPGRLEVGNRNYVHVLYMYISSNVIFRGYQVMRTMPHQQGTAPAAFSSTTSHTTIPISLFCVPASHTRTFGSNCSS